MNIVQITDDFLFRLNELLTFAIGEQPDFNLLKSEISNFIKYNPTHLHEFVPYAFEQDLYDYFLAIQGFVKSFEELDKFNDATFYETIYDLLKDVYDFKVCLLSVKH